MGEHALILFCRCAVSEAMPQATVERVAQVLADGGVPHLDIADLCAVATALHGSRDDDADNGWQAFSAALHDAGKILVIACEPRAVSSLLEWGGIRLGGSVRLISLRAADAGEELSAWLAEVRGVETPASPPPATDAWIPWFPVIDYARCIGCRKCFDFCLFGVYAIENEKVVVRNPRKCKNKCPACARVCPVQAVIFPKFGQAPVNGGEAEAVRHAAESAAPLAAKKQRRRQLFSDDFEKGL